MSWVDILSGNGANRDWCASSSTADARLSVSPDSVDLSTY